MKVLGISANSRIVGMAVVNDNTLFDFKTRLFKEGWSTVKASRIITCLLHYVREHHVTSIAIVIPHVHHQTPQSKALIEKITVSFRKKEIKVSTYSPEAFHSFCEKTKTKKKTLMQEMATIHPELSYLRRKELSNKNKYYIKLFEATAVAMLLAKENAEHRFRE